MTKLERKREQARLRKQNQRRREGGGVTGSKVPRLSGQLTSTSAQGFLTSALNDYVFRKVDGNFYEILREGIPIFDAAIRKLTSLNGTVRIIGDNPALVKELEDFCLNVPVNDVQKGIHSFAENTANETFEQGFCLSEFVANRKRDDIDRLVVADSKNIFFRKNKTTGRAEPWVRSGTATASRYTMPASVISQILTARYGTSVSYNGVTETLLSPDNKIYFSINNENQDPHGVSLFRSTEFIAQIIATMQNSMKNVAERFGDPSFHVHYESAGKSDATLAARRTAMEADFNSVITAKRAGKSGDFITAGTVGSKVAVTVIGHDGQLFEYDIPLRHLLEQCVSKFGLPAWMLGIYWSTTERMATLEVEMALADAKIRQYAMLPEYIRLFSNFLTLRGRTWKSVTTSLDKKGDWGVIFESPNLHDLVAQAQAGFLNAQADMMRRGGSIPTATTQNPATIVPVSGASVEIGGIKYPVFQEQGCGCGKEHASDKSHAPSPSYAKELNRPIPWPKLDALEAEYETRLKSDWQKLQGKVFGILGLKFPIEQGTASLSPLPSEGEGRVRGGLKAFSFDDTQRAQILKALKDHLGWYEPAAADSVVAWHYAQAYSLGLIQAAELVGKERPLLDILQNNETYTEMITNGFRLVKDNATRAIRNDVIMAMEQGMVDGVNPRDVASELEGIFGSANSDWERLARTEMAGAAERAKLDEWEERDVDVSNAVTVPVHPRCRCSTTIKDDNGKLSAVFAPAPDACPWCLSLQEGDKRQA